MGLYPLTSSSGPGKVCPNGRRLLVQGSGAGEGGTRRDHRESTPIDDVLLTRPSSNLVTKLSRAPTQTLRLRPMKGGRRKAQTRLPLLSPEARTHNALTPSFTHSRRSHRIVVAEFRVAWIPRPDLYSTFLVNGSGFCSIGNRQ